MLRSLLPLLSLFPLAAGAAEVAWSGGAGAWSDAAKWTGGACPGIGDVAAFAPAGGTIEVREDATVGGLALGPAKGFIRVARDFTVGVAEGDGSPVVCTPGSPAGVEIHGRRMTLRRGNLGTVTLGGSWTATPGSTIELLCAVNGGIRLVNTGTLVQDGTEVLFHWTDGASSTRLFQNAAGATWRMANGSRIGMNHEKGDASASHTVLETSRNDGEMRIEGGSEIPVTRFDNNGGLVLGTCRLGGPAKFECLVRNESHGVVTVVGDAKIGHDEAHGSVYARFENGGEDQRGASLRVGDGRSPATFTLMSGTMTVSNAAGCTAEVAAGSTLALLAPDQGFGNNPRGTRIINNGEWVQRGRLQFRPVANAPQIPGINNLGSLRFAGDEVVIERLPSRNPYFFEGAETSLYNNRSGVLGGAARVSYANKSGIAVGDSLQVISSGTIAPGTTERVGTLNFVNADVRFSDTGTGKLEIRIAGADAADQLTLTGDHGGGLILSEEGSTLAVSVLPGAVLPKTGRWRIVAAKRVVGAFATVNLPAGFSLVSDDQGLSLSYVR